MRIQYYIYSCILSTLIFSCADNDSYKLEKHVQEVPPYNVNEHGPRVSSRASNTNTCECTLTNVCSAKKTCPSGKDCDCECTQGTYEHKCKCGPCNHSASSFAHLSHDLYMTQEQYDIWNEFQTILYNDMTSNGALSRQYQLDALNALQPDDFHAFGVAKSNLMASLPALNASTKSLINAFYDKHDFYNDTRL